MSRLTACRVTGPKRARCGGWETRDDDGEADSELVDRVVAVFATQTCVPSDETPRGSLPTPMVSTTAPVEALISVTVVSPRFATQTWVPSDETAWDRRPRRWSGPPPRSRH